MTEADAETEAGFPLRQGHFVKLAAFRQLNGMTLADSLQPFRHRKTSSKGGSCFGIDGYEAGGMETRMEETSKKSTKRTTKKNISNEAELNSEIGTLQNKRIMNAALDVVNKQTIAGTRMHLIADKAKMVQSNVHYYYKTKNELMLALQEYIFEECYDARRKEKKHSKDSLDSQLDVFINQKKRLIMTKPKYDFAEVDFWVQSKINSEIHEKFNQSYTKWKCEIREILDKYCPWLDAKSRELIPFTFISLMEGATIQYMINRDEFDVEGYFDMCKQLMLNQINSMKPQQ